MMYPDRRSRVRFALFALTAPIGIAFIGCDGGPDSLFDPEPHFAYADGGDPEFALCNDPTPGEKWTVEVTSSGGTFTMGPNTLIVPANTVSTSAIMYLKELSSSSLRVRLSSTQTLNQTVEVVMSTQNCEIDAAQTVWSYDEATQVLDDLMANQPNTNNETMRFWTIQPGAYALAD